MKKSFKKKVNRLEKTSVNQLQKRENKLSAKKKIEGKTLSSFRDEERKEDQREQMGIAEIGGCGSGCRR